MDADDKRVNSMLARLDEFHAKFIKERKTLRSSLHAANTKIVELEAHVARYQEKCKQIEAEKIALTDMIEKLQSRLDGYLKDIDMASIPSVASVENNNTEEISSSNEVLVNLGNSTDSASSPQNTPRRLSADERQASPNVSALKRNCDNLIDNQDADISQQNQLQLETVSQFVCNTEIVTGTDGISSYFSNFYIDPLSVNSDETPAVSSITIPPIIKMILSSYHRFDKRFLVFVTDTTASKDCHFLSIDDLLALPENADLVQQLHDSQSNTSEGGQNLSLFTVLGQLIARMSPSIPKSVDVENPVVTPAIEPSVKTEENINVAAGTKRGRGRSITKKEDTKKKKPGFTSVSKEDNDMCVGVSLGELNSTPKKEFKIQCKVCEIIEYKESFFKTRATLDSHIIKAHPLNAFPIYLRCPYDEDDCSRHFLQEKGLRNHIKTCHPDANPSAVLECKPKMKSLVCTYCGDEFLSNRIFRKHMKDHHDIFARTTEIMKSSDPCDRRKIFETESSNDSTEKPSVRKRSNVSFSRKHLLSCLDDSDSDAISIPSTSRKEIHRRGPKFRKKEENPELLRTNAAVTETEIHREKVPTESEEHISSSQKTSSSKSIHQNDSPRVDNQVNPSSSTAEPTDINEFVLSSVYEISSYIEKHNLVSQRPSGIDLPPVDSPTEKVYHTLTAPQTSDKSQSSQYSAIPSLPCLLDDCPGCDVHPKPPVISFTLDDEYVSSCREDILAELYSIPDNPPIIPGSFSAAIYDSVHLGTNRGDGKVVNEPTSSVNGHDIANIIIADDQCSRGTRDIANIFISDDVEPSRENNKNNWLSDQTDSDHPSLPDEERRTIIDKTARTENLASSDEEKNQDELVTKEQPVLKDHCPVETDTIENQSKTVDGLDANSIRQESSPIRENNFKNNESVIENQNETAKGPGDNPVTHDSSAIREDHRENNEAAIEKQNETAGGLDDNPVSHNSSPIREDHFEIDEAVIENQNGIAESLDNDPICNNSSPICEDESEINIAAIENQNGTAKGLDNNSAGHDSSAIPEDIEKDETTIENQNDTAIGLDNNSTCHDSSAIPEDIENNETRIENQIDTAKHLDNHPVCDNSTPICDVQSKINESVIERHDETANDFDDNSIRHHSSTIPEDIVENNETLATNDDDRMCESNFDQNKIADEENQKEKTDIDRDIVDESPSIPSEISTSTINPSKIDENLPTNSTPRESADCDQSIIAKSGSNENEMEIDDTPSISTPNVPVVEDQIVSSKSSVDDQIPNSPIPEAISTISGSSENYTVTNNSISTTLVPIKKQFRKSIFDPESYPATPNCDPIVDMEISTAPENESNRPINVESEISDGDDSSTVSVNGEKDLEPVKFISVDDMSEETVSDANHEDNMPAIDPENPQNDQNLPNGASSPKSTPELEPMTDTVELSQPHSTPPNITPIEEENGDANQMDTSFSISSLNQSNSSVNSTFYGEFGLSSVCEIETVGEKKSMDADTPCSMLNQPSSPKRVDITPILNKILSRSGSVRCTNEIIEGIGIELEVEESSSTESSPQRSEDMNISSLSRSEKEFPNLAGEKRKNDDCVETSPHPVIKSPQGPDAPKKSPCVVLNDNPTFASLVKRMLSEQILGKSSNEIAETVDVEISALPVSRSPSPEPSLSTSSPNNPIDKKTDSGGKLDDIGVEKDSSETVPIVESASPRIRHEKEKDFGNDIVPLMGSPPPSSLPVENPPQVQDNANQCSLVDTTQTSPNQPDQSFEFTPTDYKLLDITVRVPRLKINRNRPLSAKYYTGRQSRVTLKPFQDLLNSAGKSKSTLRRVNRCLVCGEIFLTTKTLKTHLNEEHAGDDRTITCSLCGHVFQTKSSLMTHRRSVHELFFADFVECKICERKVTYDSFEALNTHIIETHPVPDPYYVKCPHGGGDCMWYFSEVEDFREHVEMYHKNEDLSVPLDKIFPGELPWQCSLCRKVYSCDEYLSEHLIRDHNQ